MNGHINDMNIAWRNCCFVMGLNLWFDDGYLGGWMDAQLFAMYEIDGMCLNMIFSCRGLSWISCFVLKEMGIIWSQHCPFTPNQTQPNHKVRLHEVIGFSLTGFEFRLDKEHTEGFSSVFGLGPKLNQLNPSLGLVPTNSLVN